MSDNSSDSSIISLFEGLINDEQEVCVIKMLLSNYSEDEIIEKIIEMSKR